MKLGDAIAKVATPIARTLGMDCIDPTTQQLRPDSGCAKRQQTLNQFSDSIYDRFWNKPNKGDNMPGIEQHEKVEYILGISFLATDPYDPDLVELVTLIRSKGGGVLSVNLRPQQQTQGTLTNQQPAAGTKVFEKGKPK